MRSPSRRWPRAPLEGDRTGNIPAIRALARRYARDTGGRVVIVEREGRGSGRLEPSDPWRAQLRIATRVRGCAARRRRDGNTPLATLGSTFLYVAVPIASGGRILGAVRITYPTSKLDARVRRYWLILALIAVIVLVAAAVLGAGFARWIRKPLAGLERAAASVERR